MSAFQKQYDWKLKSPVQTAVQLVKYTQTIDLDINKKTKINLKEYNYDTKIRVKSFDQGKQM